MIILNDKNNIQEKIIWSGYNFFTITFYISTTCNNCVVNWFSLYGIL